MTLLGKGDPGSVLDKLDEKLLVRLVRDVLACRGHASTRITDGPGDATRDIFSQRLSQNHLTQCKFHKQNSKACSSREVSELPMGLVKHGYKCGLFATNARISPAAKRELLDNYPGLRLEFLDGDELAAEALDNPVLRTLWYDGEHLQNMSSRVTLPIIVRMHDGDAPLPPCEADSLARNLLAKAANRALGSLGHLRFETGARNYWTQQSFFPYRLPTDRCFSEGGLPFIEVFAVSLVGSVAVTDIQTAAEAVAREFGGELVESIGAASIVVGRPALEPTSGSPGGEGMQLEIDPVRVVAERAGVFSEREWFLPDQAGGWSTDCDARMTQMSLVRLYDRQHDLCTSYELRIPLTETQEMNRQTHRRAWDMCLYALVPRGFDGDCDHGVPAPDVLEEWGSSEYPAWERNPHLLAAWWHACYVQEDTCFDPRRDGGHAAVGGESERLEAIRTALGKLPECHPVSPRTSRLLAALSGWGPSGGGEFTYADTAELLTNFSGLPSPVDPCARRFRVTVAWEVAGEPQRVASHVRTLVHGRDAHVEVENGRVLMHDMASGLDLTASTDRVLGALRSVARTLVEGIERQTPFGLKRATDAHWRDRYRVRLGLGYGQAEPE